jgi:hypothetical protein
LYDIITIEYIIVVKKEYFMKKLCLLLGLVVLGTAINVNAMERPLEWQKLDQFTNRRDIQWASVINFLNKNKDPKLIDEYRDLIYGEPLLELAVEQYNVAIARLLLERFHAKVTDNMLYEAKSYVDDSDGLVELLSKYYRK